MTPWFSCAGKDGLTTAANLRGHAEGHFIVDDGVRLRVRSVFVSPNEMVGVNLENGDRRYFMPGDRVRVEKYKESV